MGKRENASERRQRREKRAEAKKIKEKKEHHKEKLKEVEEPEEDIDKILKELELASARRAAKVEIVAAPSPRSHASFLSTVNDELVLFGGENFDGRRTLVFDDVFIYNIKKNEWKKYTLDKGPGPRCAHQAVYVPRNGGEMWVFGGEFSSPNGNQFHHFNELWVLRMEKMEWEKIDVKGGPSPRSGHRMVLWRRLLVVFGGFHDNARKAPRYFNDLHVFDLDSYTWHRVEFPAIFITPECRSACQLYAGPECIMLSGGYSKVCLKGDNYRGKVFTDMWRLTCAPEGPADKYGRKPPCSGAGLQWTWARVKPSGVMPSERCGCTAVSRNPTSVVMFGGVCDRETDDAIQGEFFNDAFLFNVEQDKFYPLEVRHREDPAAEKERRAEKEKRAEPARRQKYQTLDDLAGPAEEEEKPRLALAAAAAAAVAPPPAAAAAAAAAAPAAVGVWPSPRMNTMMAVNGSVLYLLGGTFEAGDKQITLMDMYSLDLAKADRWVLLQDNDPATQQWLGESSSSSSESEDSDDDTGSSSD